MLRTCCSRRCSHSGRSRCLIFAFHVCLGLLPACLPVSVYVCVCVFTFSLLCFCFRPSSAFFVTACVCAAYCRCALTAASRRASSARQRERASASESGHVTENKRGCNFEINDDGNDEQERGSRVVGREKSWKARRTSRRMQQCICRQELQARRQCCSALACAGIPSMLILLLITIARSRFVTNSTVLAWNRKGAGTEITGSGFCF